MVLADSRFDSITFIVTNKVGHYLTRHWAVPQSRMVEVADVPFVPTMERFHGLLCRWRYRKILSLASVIIHPEFRTYLGCSIPQAVVLYDLIFLEPPRFSGTYKPSRDWYFRYKVRQALKARYLVSISAFTKLQAIRFFPKAHLERITPLPLSCRSGIRGGGALKRLSPSQRIHFLYVGSMDDRKNVIPMIESFHQVCAQHSVVLHLAGSSRHDMQKIIDTSQQNRCETTQIIFHNKVNDQELTELYAKAHFFVFPSLMEGFGLPPLEAMSHGLVVFAFNNSAIPEAVGDAAVLCEDNDFGGWGEAFDRMLKNPLEYQALSKKSIEQAAVLSETAMFKRYSEYFTMLISDCTR
jgi:glycosyltransferase involved in cell wall biosynthesis